VSQQRRKERLSKLLIQHCADNNLSGNKLAKILEVSQTSAQAYLDGMTFPGEDARRRIATLLRLSFDELNAKLDDRPLPTELPLDKICQEVREMQIEDFLQIYQVVVDRAATEMAEALSRRDRFR
jgi:transcriptional regulator with XRE-family HTH domain